MEAHNFSLQASNTIIHTCNKKKRDAASVSLARTLMKKVFSIGTTTSRITENNLEEREDEDESKEEAPQREDKRVALKGMQMLSGEQSKAMSFKTGEEGNMKDREDKKREFQDLDKNMKKAEAELTESG